MVLGRQFIDMARRLGVANIEAGIGHGVGRPVGHEGAATAIRHPDARMLAVHAEFRIGEVDEFAVG